MSEIHFSLTEFICVNMVI